MLPAVDGLICELELAGAEFLVVGIVVVVEVGRPLTVGTVKRVMLSLVMILVNKW